MTPEPCLSPSAPSTILLCVAHGSRDPRWRQPFEQLFASLGAAITPDSSSHAVLAYMEMATPTPEEALALYLAKGTVQAVNIFPLFMAAGAHVANELTELKHHLQAQYPSFNVRLLPPFGELPEVQTLMQQVIQAKLHSCHVEQH
ncbi:MAG: sirohydrochlorin chelatase [Vampirovibrionales bacterium]